MLRNTSLLKPTRGARFSTTKKLRYSKYYGIFTAERRHVTLVEQSTRLCRAVVKLSAIRRRPSCDYVDYHFLEMTRSNETVHASEQNNLIMEVVQHFVENAIGPTLVLIRDWTNLDLHRSRQQNFRYFGPQILEATSHYDMTRR